MVKDLGEDRLGKEITTVKFHPYRAEDYEDVCTFLIVLNQNDKRHINWNWARFEWMMEHPEFDKSTIRSIGLWWERERLVGAAIYDMYFGEAFCAILPKYEMLYPEILEYAGRELKDETGLGISICDGHTREIDAARAAGFVRADQSETVMKLDLDQAFSVELPERLYFAELDPATDAYTFQWLLWQGFDHGTNRTEFENSEHIIPQIRPHFKLHLSVAAVNAKKEPVSYCCLWFHEGTDYAYLEPVCTIPSCRGKGIAKAVIFEALNRVKALGARWVYVISDMEFYEKLGFRKDLHYSFYWKA